MDMSAQLQRVWLILTQVRVVGDNPVGYTLGSKAYVQCFVPEADIEPALLEVSRLVGSEGMERIDVIKCVSFDEAWTDDDEVPDFIRKDVDEARRSGKALAGTFIHGRESASFQNDQQEKTLLVAEDIFKMTRR